MAITTTFPELKEMSVQPDPTTRDFVFNQTMLRVKNPERSVEFYTKVASMRRPRSRSWR